MQVQLHIIHVHAQDNYVLHWLICVKSTQLVTIHYPNPTTVQRQQLYLTRLSLLQTRALR